MADLKFVDQHNMVAYLEKSDENAEFHQIVDFLSTCSINYALTVSPTIYASYIEQFWNTASSKIINSVKQIHAIIDGKAVVISESSVRSDLLFNDEDGLKDLPEPFNDTYVTPCHTKKVFSNMARKSVNFSRTITPLFASMLVQNQALEGEGSAVHPEPQPTPSTSKPNVSEPQIASFHIETSPTTAPQTEAHQTAVSQIVFHEAHTEKILPSPTTYQRKRKTQKRKRTKKDIELPHTSVPLDHGAYEAVRKEGVTVWKGLSLLWQSQAPRHHGGTPAQTRSERVLAQPNEPPLLEGHTSGSGEGRMEHTFELTDNVPSTPYDSPLPGGYTPGSDEGRMKLDELITLCTKLSKQVLDLEKEKDTQALEILKLKKRVKRLERKSKSSISHPRRRKYRQVETSSDDDLDEADASKQGRRSDKLKPMFKDKDFEELDDHIENIEEETVDAAATGVSTVSAPVSTAGVTISTAELRAPPTTTTVFDDEDVTMAMTQTLIKMKERKAKEKGVAITDIEDSYRIVRPVRSITTLQPLPTIDPKDKGKGILVEEEPVKIKMRDQGDLQVQADAELAQILHEEELAELERSQQERQRQEDDTNAALAKEFDEIQARIDADAGHELAKQLAAARADAIRNKPPTKTQVRNRMITYLKYMAIKDSEKKVNSSSKPAGGKDVAEEQESAKSDEEADADYKHEKEELRMWLTVVSDEEETVDPKILSTKYPIVDWESHNLGNVDMEDLYVYKIIRADGNTSYYKSLSKDEIWNNQQDWTLISWKLYKSCRVHTLLMDDTLTSFNMLVEKMYPLIKEMLQKMLNWKLEAEAESTMAFELLKFIKSQLEE
ncbi:hypothetical protein Tco_1304463 [Tanacetum coccineum]